MKTQLQYVRILSVSAYREQGSWTWDSWMEVGSAGKELLELSTRGLLKYLREEGFLSRGSIGQVAVEDDQYNLVVVDRSTRQPLFAVEYGCHV